MQTTTGGPRWLDRRDIIKKDFRGAYAIYVRSLSRQRSASITTPEPLQMAIHMTQMTTSMPLASPPSYLKLHMPSFSLFQYAPEALCIPLLPTLLLSPAVSTPPGRASDKCWMIVLLTANLNGAGESADGFDSEISDWRIFDCNETSVFVTRECLPAYDICSYDP